MVVDRGGGRDAIAAAGAAVGGGGLGGGADEMRGAEAEAGAACKDELRLGAGAGDDAAAR